jgi:hypothetical protein
MAVLSTNFSKHLNHFLIVYRTRGTLRFDAPTPDRRDGQAAAVRHAGLVGDSIGQAEKTLHCN